MKGLSVSIAPSCIVYSCKIFKYISNLELMYPANSIITEQCLEIIMVCFSHFVKIINRQKHCKEFRDRHSQPDSIYADEFRKKKDIHYNHSECTDEGDDSRDFSVRKCGKHGRGEDINTCKNIVDRE